MNAAGVSPPPRSAKQLATPVQTRTKYAAAKKGDKVPVIDATKAVR